MLITLPFFFRSELTRPVSNLSPLALTIRLSAPPLSLAAFSLPPCLRLCSRWRRCNANGTCYYETASCRNVLRFLHSTSPWHSKQKESRQVLQATNGGPVDRLLTVVEASCPFLHCILVNNKSSLYSFCRYYNSCCSCWRDGGLRRPNSNRSRSLRRNPRERS